jgi:hypothetical protein
MLSVASSLTPKSTPTTPTNFGVDLVSTLYAKAMYQSSAIRDIVNLVVVV